MFAETLSNIAVQAPVPSTVASLIVVWKMELAIDCCDFGKEDTTYILKLPSQHKRLGRKECSVECSH
jgi:hypothetical protein